METLTRFGTHNSTHVDAPWHYNSTIAGEPAQTIDELPLDWFFSDGVVLDMTAKADGESRRRGRPGGRARAHRARARELDIVLVRTGRDAALWRAGLHGAGPRRDRRGNALAVRARRARDGHRRLGLGRAAAHPGRSRRSSATSPESSGPPTRPTCPTRRSSAWSTSASCRPPASRSRASRCGSWAAAPRRRGWWRSCRTSLAEPGQWPEVGPLVVGSRLAGRRLAMAVDPGRAHAEPLCRGDVVLEPEGHVQNLRGGGSMSRRACSKGSVAGL